MSTDASTTAKFETPVDTAARLKREGLSPVGLLGERGARSVPHPDKMHENDIFQRGVVVGVDEVSKQASIVRELGEQESDPAFLDHGHPKHDTLIKRRSLLYRQLHPEKT